MNRNIMVSLKGNQTNSEGESEPIEVITTGSYYFKGDSHYVIYDEGVAGEAELSHSTLKFSADEVMLKRTGPGAVTMYFNTEAKTQSGYGTPYGNLVVGIETERIDLEEQDDYMKLEIKYILDVNYEYAADCTLELEIRSLVP